MSDAASLLPSSATRQERAIEQAIARMSELPVPLRSLHRADTCPAQLLPWLAWARGLDEWDDKWSDEAKRAVVQRSYAIHAHKGSVQSIRDVLASAGYGDARIIEGLDAERYDGAITHNGDMFYGQSAEHWAMYRVYLSRPITVAQAAQVRRLLAITAPARCRLEGLHYTEALNIYDGRIRYDGQYTHGVA